jgi:hypothetical protein
MPNVGVWLCFSENPRRLAAVVFRALFAAVLIPLTFVGCGKHTPKESPESQSAPAKRYAYGDWVGLATRLRQAGIKSRLALCCCPQASVPRGRHPGRSGLHLLRRSVQGRSHRSESASVYLQRLVRMEQSLPAVQRRTHALPSRT